MRKTDIICVFLSSLNYHSANVLGKESVDRKIANGNSFLRLNLDENTTAIYLNGSSGNDANDGSSKDLAVRTFERAKQIASSYQNITTIFITGQVEINGEISLEGTNAIIKREKSYNGYLFFVAPSNEATLSNITIDGNSEQATEVNSALIHCKGILNIEENTILQNNKIDPKKNSPINGGGAIFCDNSDKGSECVVNMMGGIIQNNTSIHGGGIFVYKGAILNMYGGKISNNKALNSKTNSGSYDEIAAGGGVCLHGGTFNMFGGYIQENTSEEIGGGISVGISTWSGYDNVFNMTGGVIDGNISRSTGGGLFIQATFGQAKSEAHITGGSLTNNRMEGEGITNHGYGGGAVYVNGYNEPGFGNGTLYMKNVLITENEAKDDGGAIASCPISKTVIYLNQGGALYGNNAERYGKEIFIVSQQTGYGAHGGNPTYHIEQTMLGGVAYNWLNDDKTPYQGPLTGILLGDGVAIRLHTESEGIDKENPLVKVYIAGNYSATRGGAIGSNGNVIIGVPDEDIEIKVGKEWNDNKNQDKIRPDSITIRLLADGKEVDFKTVTETDGWECLFTQLPKYNSSGVEIIYTISEDTVTGYKCEVSGDVTNGFTVTNTPVINFSVTKIWDDAENQDGIRPDLVTIMLVADNQETGKILVLNENNDWTGSFTNLDKYSSNKEIVYEVKEIDLHEDYKDNYDYDNNTLTCTITNCHIPEKITIKSITKWDDEDDVDETRPDTITIRLLADGEEVDSKTVTKTDGWKWEFTDLDKFKDGEEIIYTITEDEVAGYESPVISGDMTGGFTITNVYKPVLVPDTGDNFNPVVWISVMVVSFVSIIILLIYRNKKLKK